MVEIVTSVGLPVDEKLIIKKNRIVPDGGADPEAMKRISIVTGIHGDELEGQYVCYESVYLCKHCGWPISIDGFIAMVDFLE